MLLNLIYTVPMALLWMIFARQFSIEGFIVGSIFGFAILMVIRVNTTFEDEDEPVRLVKIPSQLLAMGIYIFRLTLNVILSGFDVAVKVLRPDMPIDPGTYTITTQDESNNALISALSGHWITITPGELVIDYGEDEHGNTTMLVHTLDKETSNFKKLEKDQTNRLKLIRQILDKDDRKKGD